MPDRLYRFGLSSGWITHLWKSIVRQDHAAWRPVLRGLLPADGVAIDVGAHGGQVTRLLAALIPRGLVVAVEPSGYTRSVLRTALWIRGVHNAVVVAAALSGQGGAALLRTPIKRYGDMGYGLAALEPAGADDTASGGQVPSGQVPDGQVAEPVAVITLDALVDTLGLQRLDFIKADIEGHEAGMVAGARKTLARFRPALLLEHDATLTARAGHDFSALWDELLSFGYQPHRIAGGAAVPILAAGRPEDGDVLWLQPR